MRILTGIQPSGKLHWGNYFGAMKPIIDLQEKGETFVFVAQYHALTTVHDAAALRERSLDVALDFLACGLDPQKACLFMQSDVPELHELAWLLSVVTPMGLLERCHSYKDKMARGIAASHGLFAYPVLMAADILAYQSDLVPVGRDQKQHVEVTRDIAAKFNQIFGREVFKMPEPMISEAVAVIPGLDGQKMSKSYNNTIGLFEEPKEVKAKIMKIATDSTPLEEPKNPEACRVFALYKLFANEAEQAEMRENYLRGGYGYGHAKKALFEIYKRTFGPFRERREDLAAHPDTVRDILAAGAAKARAVARETLAAARDAVGL
ncbi:MAG: tryptophan--tRNA ligase [Lentisphaeraceae bacterium]|nr:tryptophan--tRNA ligase [Lentisphaeraceae bacterium]